MHPSTCLLPSSKFPQGSNLLISQSEPSAQPAGKTTAAYCMLDFSTSKINMQGISEARNSVTGQVDKIG
jgi:hypothetical protein